MMRVIIESPLAGDRRRNEAYAKRLLLDALRRGEAGFLSHLMYPLVLDDRIPEERELGMAAGFSWGEAAAKCVVGMDYGVSPGMAAGIERWRALGIPIEERWLDRKPEEASDERE